MTQGTMEYYNQKLFGVRKETLERLETLYGKEYFSEDRYGRGAQQFSEEEQRRQRMYRQELARIQHYVPHFAHGGNVLDIGCGTGAFLSLWGTTWQKYGIELSDYASHCARQRGVVTAFDPRDNFFDVIVFRGTLQHIPDPLYKISECYYWLKPGGAIIFLATPNTHSPVYRLFQNLPMIKEPLNFLLPSDKMLLQILTNFGFKDIYFYYPYRGTPYAQPVKNIIAFALRLLRIKTKTNFAFFHNVLECYARK